MKSFLTKKYLCPPKREILNIKRGINGFYINIGWLKIVAMGTIYDSEIRRMKRMRIAFLRFSVIASRGYLQMDRKSCPFLISSHLLNFYLKENHSTCTCMTMNVFKQTAVWLVQKSTYSNTRVLFNCGQKLVQTPFKSCRRWRLFFGDPVLHGWSPDWSLTVSCIE